MIYYLQTPLAEADVRQLCAGDQIFLSGQAFTGRSRIHRYVFDEGRPLPFSTAQCNAMIHAGPITVREGEAWRLVSFMPTSSIRFEKWGAQAVEQWGLRMIVGKTTMRESTMRAMQRFGCVHVSPQCVSPNLWLAAIRIDGVELFDELGSIEAAWRLSLDKLGPFIVDIDAKGNNYFSEMDRRVASVRDRILRDMGVPEDFQPTRLY
ncbi:MAG: fumarate hydratase C-terminal domain-containing protein [Clostridia bacterium]|nr:fumarate hydratase C-terminal domain-containing protein [Clostridia bacterium]